MRHNFVDEKWTKFWTLAQYNVQYSIYCLNRLDIECWVVAFRTGQILTLKLLDWWADSPNFFICKSCTVNSFRSWCWILYSCESHVLCLSQSQCLSCAQILWSHIKWYFLELWTGVWVRDMRSVPRGIGKETADWRTRTLWILDYVGYHTSSIWNKTRKEVSTVQKLMEL